MRCRGGVLPPEKDRHEMLGRVVGSGFHARPQVQLADIGIEIQKSIEYVINDNEMIEIPQYIIMPNHVHLIVILKAVGHGNPTLQSVIGRIKSYTAKRWSEICETKYQTFWQSRFHDHIIRDEAEYQRICSISTKTRRVGQKTNTLFSQRRTYMIWRTLCALSGNNCAD